MQFSNYRPRLCCKPQLQIRQPQLCLRPPPRLFPMHGTTATADEQGPPPSTSRHPLSSSSIPAKNKTASSVPGATSSPTVQESFFKTITKRLQQLETNITLSLRYVEGNSKYLQETLHKLERKQLAKADNFLDGLNLTVFTELRSVRQQYDQVWQSTVIALESQKSNLRGNCSHSAPG